MNKTCKQCSSEFEITNDDLAFYEKISPVFDGKKYQIPPPTLCPDCRFQRRVATRNPYILYKRVCDFCKKVIISAYSKDKPYAIYCQDCWWSGKWDSLQFGRVFDFSIPFFEQFAELQKSVPRLTLMNKAAENSEYCNYAGFNRNCYLAVDGSWYNEGCMYGSYYAHSKDCSDCWGVGKSELCYEITWGEGLYHCIFCTDCFNCSECFLSSNLRNCNNCIICSNLRNKDYHICNKQVSKEKFESESKKLHSYVSLNNLLKEYLSLRQESIYPENVNVNCENCTGQYMHNCKNVFNSFMMFYVEDGKFGYQNEEGKDMMDCSSTGYNGPNLLYYECANAGDYGERCLFSFNNWACNDVLYCDTTQSCSQCFGCSNMNRQKFCILNKQYTKEEYEELVPKIIEHMQSTGEWGEFFPINISPFAYNETTAYEHVPFTKEEVEANGWGWQDAKDEVPKVEKIIKASQLPDSIADVPNDILNWAIECKATSRPFRIVKQELDFYRRMKLPIPHFHPDERHKRRIKLRNPRKLWSRKCAKCNKEIQTTYAPERPEIVYCEDCYLKEVY